MPLDLHFELRLEERQSDRVFVSVVLAPAGSPQTSVEGVSVQMLDRGGVPLGPRMVLPLSGAILQPLITTVEVRARGPVPPGARVIGSAWRAEAQLDASCPCDPGTQLEVHMRGRRTIGLPANDRGLRGLDPIERETLGTAMPWVNEPRSQDPTRPAVLESPEPDPAEIVDEVADAYGLDPEDAELLKQLLEED